MTHKSMHKYIVNISNLTLLELGKIKICIYRIKTANTGMVQ